jgi:hypothetical protein
MTYIKMIRNDGFCGIMKMKEENILCFMMKYLHVFNVYMGNQFPLNLNLGYGIVIVVLHVKPNIGMIK